MKKFKRICKIIYKSRFNVSKIMALGNDGNYFYLSKYHDWSFIKTMLFLIKSKYAWSEFKTDN